MARQAVVERRTRETDIAVTLELDGAGRADIDTGIGFFDHMLEGFARHGLFDLTVRCKGDLQVDGGIKASGAITPDTSVNVE